ncbi:hypothetical protein D9M70_471690 [compost metagenome]
MHQSLQRPFRGTVGRTADTASLASDRRNIDDAAITLPLHETGGGLGAEKSTDQIDGKHVRKVLTGRFGAVLDHRDARAIEQNVEPTEQFERPFGKPLGLTLPAQVGGDPLSLYALCPQILRDLPHSLAIDICQQQSGAFPSEGACRSRADTATCTRHERDPVL